MFRGDSERGFFMEDTMDGPLSNAQFISVVIVAIALVIWFKVGRASKEPKAA
jgi:hypothetical protein